jgi:hypothetical protein
MSRILFAVVLVALALPASAEARSCSVAGKERKLGATYVTSLSATGVSCRTAESVVRSFHKCRRANGGADGRCPRVRGYRCSDKRRKAPTQFDSTTTCKRGSKRITFKYTQFT